MNKKQTFECRVPLLALLFCAWVGSLCAATERYVDLNSTNPVPPYTSWSTATPVIQHAVNMSAAGDTIRLASGDYYQQVLISNRSSIKVIGTPGTVLHPAAGFTALSSSVYPVVGIYRSYAEFSDLTIDGDHLGSSSLTGYNYLVGLYFYGAGGQVTNCVFKGFCGSPVDLQSTGEGLRCWNPVSAGYGIAQIRVFNSSFLENSTAFQLFGDPASNPGSTRVAVTITGNVITGLGATPDIAHFGIAVRNGVTGVIRDNIITGHCYNGPLNTWASAISAYDSGYSSRGYFYPLLPMVYQGNTFSNNDNHVVLIAANSSQVTSNTFQAVSNRPRWGSLAISGTNVMVANNSFADMPIGIELYGGEMLGGVLMGTAANPRLLTNRFCGVDMPLRIQPMATGLVEEGSEFPCPAHEPRILEVPGEYATIQAAVDAGRVGDTIHIAAGDYYEQVVVANKVKLTFEGEPGTVIHATQTMTEPFRLYGLLGYPVLGVFKSEVVLSGLTLEGDQLGDIYPGSAGLFGIFLLGSGGEVRSCMVRGFRPSATTSSTESHGLQAYNILRVGSPAVNISVSNSDFLDNQVGMLLRGDPLDYPDMLRTTVNIKGNTITGIGPAPIWSVGIWVVCGVAGELTGNTLSDFIGTGSFTSAGIAGYDGGASGSRWQYVPLQPLVIAGNSFSNNGQHLRLIGANGAQVVNNSFLGTALDTGKWGAALLGGTNLVVAGNNFADTARAMFVAGNTNFNDWPPMPPTADSVFRDNWFCGVLEPIYLNPGATGVQEQGARTCENGPLNPVFQSLSGPGPEGVALLLRGWHGDTVVIEESTNLVDWVPMHTNLMNLPTFEYIDREATNKPQCFYRVTGP